MKKERVIEKEGDSKSELEGGRECVCKKVKKRGRDNEKERGRVTMRERARKKD